MKIKVDDNGDDIVIKFSNDNVYYVTGNHGGSLYLDEETADSLAFHLQTILQERDRKKNKKIS